MTRGVRWLLIVICLLATVGCVPYPHRYQHLPAVEGQLTEAGAPLAGARVALQFRADSVCDKPEATTTTDSAGRFSLPGERRIRLYIFALPFHSFESWSFCFVAPTQAPVAWTSPSQYRAGPRYGPEIMQLECDLARNAESVCRVLSQRYRKW